MKSKKILLDHGSGGKIAHQLIIETVLPVLDNPILSVLHDGAILDIEGKRMAFTTDSYVVDPIFFPGGNIGDLAVNGTVNDLAVCGALPLYLSLGCIIEEGFPIADLKTVLNTIRDASNRAGVYIVTGDTKVVPKGAADKLFINTSGIGVIYEHADISPKRAKPGDKILISGTMADHGISVLIQREGLSFDTSIVSDTAPLNHMIRQILDIGKRDIHVLRDPTRGGVGTALNEIAEASNVGIRIAEERLPVRSDVAGVCELLGFDPLYIANEGKLIAFIEPSCADEILQVIKSCEYGSDACIIGEVVSEHPGKVYMKTAIGGTRIVDMLSGEQLPRIC